MADGSGNAATYASRFFRGHDGLKLHYREYSGPDKDGFPVICLPGLSRNARDFEELATHLSRRFRVFCLEFRGRGLSEYAPDPMCYVPNSYVRDLAAFFEATRIREAALIGTSLGGLVATVFAALKPRNVSGIILNDVGPEVDPAGLARIAGYVLKTSPVVTWEDAARAVAAIDAPIYPGFGEDAWRRLARQRYREQADGSVRPDYDLAISRPFTSAATNPDQWPFFRQLRGIPALVLRGALSDILSASTVRRMQAAVPNLAAVEVPERGHVPLLNEPVALTAIDEFLDRLPARMAIGERLRRGMASWRFRRAMARAGNALAGLGRQ